MPVFFFIDPEFTEDPQMEDINELVLSYTFFEARDGIRLPISNYIKTSRD
jgi:cytochrome c oxidase assembly protein subunit 11